MSDGFIGEINIFGGNFAPRDWAFCNGNLLPIAQNTALFSILGTTYGGDGRVTFGLPDLRGRSPRGSEGDQAGPGLTAVRLGEKGGGVSQTLVEVNLVNHFHYQQVSTEDTTTADPAVGAVLATAGESFYVVNSSALADGPNTSSVGSSQPFSILNPYLGLNYIIRTQGIYPSRS